MEWEGGEPKVNKRKRVKVSNAAKILNEVTPGKSTGLDARTLVGNFDIVVNSDGSQAIEQQQVVVTKWR